jgi:hypothetical protein
MSYSAYIHRYNNFNKKKFPFGCYKMLNIKNLGLDCYLVLKATELPAAPAENSAYSW